MSAPQALIAFFQKEAGEYLDRLDQLLADPAARAPWYNATGTGLYVLGMMACAIAIGASR